MSCRNPHECRFENPSGKSADQKVGENVINTFLVTGKPVNFFLCQIELLLSVKCNIRFFSAYKHKIQIYEAYLRILGRPRQT